MDKNAIKKYAVWARRELIERVSQRAMIYGITAKDDGDPNAESVNGHLLSQKEKRQRQALIRNIKAKGYEQVMEEVAYTWFNRFAALRFMEVNGYLPSHIRVFTNDAGEFKPQILSEAIHLELDGLDMNKVYELESDNKSEELFKYLLIVQCNALNSILPGMFQRIDDYTELLLPDYLLREGSVIEQMVTTIPEVDWTDQVQIIGWLYQYYNTEPKAAVFAKKGTVTKSEVPAATQLFTPDWIVHYMVENSLGRFWLEGHQNDALKSEWKYYLDEAAQETNVQMQLETARKEHAAQKPEEIRVIDPCMGSGHILCVLFDVLVRIYEDYGYTAREAAVKIVENNLWGVDIDERAAQLAYFAVMMKARQYDRRFFTRKVQPHVYVIEESNGITSASLHDMGLNLTQDEYSVAIKQIMHLIDEMHDAKEYGSILRVSQYNWELLRRFAVPREEEGQLRLDVHGETEASQRLQKIINIGEALANAYDVSITNPPYLVVGNCSGKVIDYVKKHYPQYKQDLYSVFIKKCNDLTKAHGYQAMITQHGWMFLSSFESMRDQVANNRFVNMAHLGPHAFEEIGGEVVQTVSFVISKRYIRDFKGTYCRLIQPNTQDGKEKMFLSGGNRYVVSQDAFRIIPGSPIAYWASDMVLRAYKEGKPLATIAEPKQGLKTGDNDTFLRLWHEIDLPRFSIFGNELTAKWFPCNKGGEYRRWYGNNDYVIDWENDGYKLKNFRHPDGRQKSRPQNLQYMKREGLTYTNISSGNLGIRYSPKGFLFDAAGSMIFTESSRLYYLLAFLGSNVATLFTSITSPTMSFEVGQLSTIPVRLVRNERIDQLAKECIILEKEDWDSFENSWDFAAHPFILSQAKEKEARPISWHYEQWKLLCERRFKQLISYEEEINKLFIEIYGLEQELSPKVDPHNVTIRKANLQRDIKSFISYAVGCMFGRYALGQSGLVYAGGEWDTSRYSRYIPDHDAIIPICDDEYFEDDIVGRFVRFVEVVFGRITLEDNLRFIADALGGKGSSREVIRSYFINDFYADHLKTYQKRPIYWLFDSGKKNGFKCLVYMHRYQPDTIARIRTDYVHEQQSRYRTAMADLEQRMSSGSTTERVKLSKQLTTLQAQAEEIRIYEEKIHHLADQMIKIDLDDGVKHNYSTFKDVLAKI